MEGIERGGRYQPARSNSLLQRERVREFARRTPLQTVREKFLMRAITLFEPWASLMAIGAKTQETRGSRTAHRGDICIHAAKRDNMTPEELVPAIIRAFESRHTQPNPNSLGCIVAVVELWDVQPSEKFIVEAPPRADRIVISKEEFAFGNYTDGRWIYRTRNLRRLAEPIPCRGLQCVGWTVPADIAEKVNAQIM